MTLRSSPSRHLLPFAGPLLLLAPMLLLGPVACKRAAPVDDSSIAAAVQSHISADTALASEPIQTSVQGGVVTLNGTVSSDAARALAASDAAQVPGIRTVVNNLIVQATALPAAAPPPVVASDPTAPAPAAPRFDNARDRRNRDRQARADRDRAAARDRALQARNDQARQSSATPPPPQVAVNLPPPAPIVNQAPPLPPPPVIRAINVPSGTILPVRLSQTLDSATTQQGDSFSGVISSDVLIDGVTVLRQGTQVSGRVTAVQEAAHFKGNSLLAIELTAVTRRGDRIPVSTEAYNAEGKGRGKNTAEKVGGGAAVGAILGGIFGGGRGAGIGAAAGGGLGAGANAVTRGEQVQIPAESLVRFRLSTPFTVRVAASGEPSSTVPEGSQRRPLN